MARQPTGNPGVKSRAGRSLPRPAPKPAPGASPALVAAPPAAAPAPKKPFNPAKFAEEVRAETRKITWPSWKETWITSVMVFAMVVVTSIFFLVIDGGLAFLANQFLKLAA